MKGHLMPEKERALQKAVENLRPHLADLRDGESFETKWVMVKGALRVVLSPKRIELTACETISVM